MQKKNRVIRYIELSEDKFYSLMEFAKSKGIYIKPSNSGFMGCQFFYGDARAFPKHDHIIAMINNESKEYKFTDSFYTLLSIID